eukprot:CAMPEP_0173300926 /NCGR_PEP_ID=MMETSP1143-20121109/17502_1 /TAXON_ID=483371 /ORGANISM="non described non described, Strain CCMP2298" /LENGTH=33 /DNA_ID= /DNA_START= /DNA_END= /DNA_ORIENTATION=
MALASAASSSSPTAMQVLTARTEAGKGLQKGCR